MNIVHSFFLHAVRVKRVTALSIVGLINCGFHPAYADQFPSLSADIVAELQYENGVGTDSGTPQSNFLFTTIEAGLSLAFTDRLGIESVILVEMLDDPAPGTNSTFEDHGIFAEELTLAYHGDNWSLHAGKFNAAFGTAWDLAPGIWGADFPEDYEVTEKIGLAANRSFGNDVSGTHTLYGSLYHADRSFLSGSLVEDRGRVQLADGGTTNTKDFSSFTLSLTGEDVLNTSGFGYHVAYRSHAHGEYDILAEREDGFVGSVFGQVPLGSADLDIILEGALLKNVEGGPDDQSYVTLGSTAHFANAWNAALSVTFRTTHVAGGINTNDHRFQASTGYAWNSGASLDFGYRYSRENGENDHVLGLLLAYAFSL